MPLRKTYMPTLDVVNFEFPIPQMDEIDDMRDWLDENNIVHRFKHNWRPFDKPGEIVNKARLDDIGPRSRLLGHGFRRNKM